MRDGHEKVEVCRIQLLVFDRFQEGLPHLAPAVLQNRLGYVPSGIEVINFGGEIHIAAEIVDSYELYSLHLLDPVAEIQVVSVVAFHIAHGDPHIVLPCAFGHFRGLTRVEGQGLFHQLADAALDAAIEGS